MSHHGSDRDPALEAMAEFKKVLEQPDTEFGKTGLYPAGVLSDTDEGGIQFGVSNYAGKVVLNFATPVTWLGMDPQQATGLANSLLKQARQANKVLVKSGKPAEPLVLNIGGK